MQKASLYVIVAIMVSLSSITLPTATDISALLGKDSILSSDHDLDKRTRVRTIEPTHAFKFEAYNVCNEKYEQCFDIWGKGTYNFSQVAAQGNYVKYKEDSTFVLEKSWWRDEDFISASDSHVSFKAEPAVKGPGLAGFIVIEVFEGETSDTGTVCVYGNLFDKQNPSSKDDADCTNNAYVQIEHKD
ncbi:MAG: hypothetical protein ACE5J2_01720 [Nitrososphaerales archaeon]